jgi:energy-coupling factor transport system permease protein
MIIVIWIAAKTKPTEYLTFLLFLIPIMLMVIVIQIFTGPAPYNELDVFGILRISISQPGLDTGLRVAIVLATMGITFLGFSMTTDPFHWGMALHRMGLPYKIAYMFGFAMRFFPLLQEELFTIGNALRARASNTVGSNSPIKLLKNASMIIIPLGLSALGRSQTIAMAMELRGFSLQQEMNIERTMYRKIQFTWRDAVVWGISLILLILTILQIAYGN